MALVVPSTVLVELDDWVLKLLGHDVWGAFLEDVDSGAYRLHHVGTPEFLRAAEARTAARDPRPRRRLK